MFYSLEVRSGLLFLRVAVGDVVRTPVITRLLVDTGFNFKADGLLGMNFTRAYGAIVDTRNARITIPDTLK